MPRKSKSQNSTASPKKVEESDNRSSKRQRTEEYSNTTTGSSSVGAPTISKPSSFDPEALGLPKDFVLTDYTRLKGCSCKVPQPKLLELLKTVSAGQAAPPAVNAESGENELVECDEGTCKRHKGNVGMDCSILPLNRKDEKGDELFIVSTTDFFFPSVEDPYLQGQVGAANVLSDMYAMGITKCDTMLMLLAASTDMDPNEERYPVTAEIMKGFVERTAQGNARVTGGQTVLNPWPLIGGVAVSVVSAAEMIPPRISLGDILVLTKPLGHQIAVNLKQWTKRPSPLYTEFIEGKVSLEEINETYDVAARNMSRLNLTGAQLMQKYKASGATDVTGFGLLGHCINYAEAHEVAKQTEDNRKDEPSLQIVVEKLPVIKGAAKASRLMNDKYRLFQGLSAETSGGLLVALSGGEEVARKFIADLASPQYGGFDSWIVGHVKERKTGEAFGVLAEDCETVEV